MRELEPRTPEGYYVMSTGQWAGFKLIWKGEDVMVYERSSAKPTETGSGPITGVDRPGLHPAARDWQAGEAGEPMDFLPGVAGSRGDPRFHALLSRIGDLHDTKQRDYGSAGDPFANVRASKKCGVKPWVGALVRLNDKVHRLQEFAKKGVLANESAKDSMLDIAVYALIMHVLYEEEEAK